MRRGGHSVQSVDRIARNIDETWDAMRPAEIGRVFVLACRCMRRSIKHNGDNSFMAEKLSCGVRRDFISTPTGIRRKDGKHLGVGVAPPGFKP